MRFATATQRRLTVTTALSRAALALVCTLTFVLMSAPVLAQGGAPPGTGMRDGSGMGRGMGPGMGQGMGRMSGQMPAFSAFDADDDGQISKDEFDQARAERIKERSQQGHQMRNLANAPSFDAIDQNDDGQIDKDEFERAQRQRMLEQQRMRQP